MHNSEQGRARKQRFQERLHVLHDNALHRKLRQHLPAAFNERWTRRHWMHASLFATIGALVATIVPGFAHHRRPLCRQPYQPGTAVAAAGHGPPAAGAR